MSADRDAAQRAATADRLADRNLTPEQRADAIADLRSDLALDEHDRQASRPTRAFGAPMTATGIVTGGGAE